MDYREAAAALWGEAGEFAHDVYARNRQLFPGLPEQLPIVIGIAAYGHALGLTRAGWAHGPRISLASGEFSRGRNRVEDVMIHEMLHVWLHLRGRAIHHDSDAWYAAVRELSPTVLGRDLDVRRGAARRSVRVPNPRADEDGQPATLVRKVRVEHAVPHGDVAR